MKDVKLLQKLAMTGKRGENTLIVVGDVHRHLEMDELFAINMRC